MAGSDRGRPIKQPEAPADTREMEPTRDGTAAVVGGALVITAATGEGRPAVVRAEPGIDLVTAGAAPSSGPVEATDARSVEVRLTADEPRLEIRVTVSQDELLALLSVERIPGATYRLEDQPPNASIVLRRLVAERIPAPEATVAELQDALDAAGVVYGVSPDALGRLCHGGVDAPVARGLPAQHTTPATVRFLTLDAGGAERFVRAGMALAQVTRPRRGTDGITVTGHLVPAGDAAEVELRVGDGVSLEADGRLLATLDGHARLAEGVVSVVAARVHEGDLRGSDGGLSSPGSVEVTGSVEDGLVRARCSIVIGEAVRGSTLEAGHSLEIRGASFDSTLRSGHGYAALIALASLIPALADDVARLQLGLGVTLAAARSAGRTLNPLRGLTMIADRVAPNLDRRMCEAVADQHGGHVPVDILGALRRAREDYDEICVGRRPIDALTSVAAAFQREAARLADLTATVPVLTVGLLQKCEVDVVGRLTVTGKGVVDSSLRVAGHFEMTGQGSVLRGGTLALSGTAVVHELQPGASTELTIELAAGSVLQAAIVQPGVLISIGGSEHRTSTLEHDVRIEAAALAA